MNRRHMVPVLVTAAVVVALGLGGLRLALAPDRSDLGRADRVVVVGVPGLAWSDLSAEATPNLWAQAEQGSVGSLTTRAARSVTCPWDGWVTLGAGDRARYGAPPADVSANPESTDDPASDQLIAGEDAAGGCLPQQTGPPPGGPDLLAPVVEANQDLGYGARPGRLGTSVECTTTVGADAPLAVAAPGADVRPVAQPTSSAGWTDTVADCPLTIYAPSPLAVADEHRATDLAALDDTVGQLATGLDDDTLLLVVGVSETGLQESALHVAIASGAQAGSGDAGGLLTSSTTGRTPYVQLIDVAPTALAALGERLPAAMDGRAFLTTPRPDDLAATVEDFTGRSAAGVEHRAAAGTFFWVITALSIGLCVLAWPILRFRPGRSGKAGRALRWTALAVGAVPVSTLLANLVPWWHAGAVGWALAGSVAAFAAAVVAVAALGPWRRARLGPELAVAVLTVSVLGLDVLLGSRLQLDSLIGYDAVVAGRFTGFGNFPFAVYGTAGLLALAALVHGRPRRVATALIVVAGGALAVVDGMPGFGADFGGVVATVPALIVFSLLALGIRASIWKLGGALFAGAAAVAAVALLDYYLRPPETRTHLGRFVEQVADGTAWTVIGRKAMSNLDLLVGSQLTLVVPAFGLILWWLLRRPDAPGRRLLATYAPTGRAALIAVAVLAGLGFAVNDSGVAVIAAAGSVLMPLFVAAATEDWPRRADSVGGAPTGGGVTVNARESRG